MERRSFIAAIGLTAFLPPSAKALEGRRRRCRRRWGSHCEDQGKPSSAATHCTWKDETQITFLVGGKFSSFKSVEPDAKASLWYWNIPDRGEFYWASHDRCWCNVYGAGTDSDEDHFEWDGTFNPTEGRVLDAAKKLHRICQELKAGPAPNLESVRLIGHSAGSNVCNFASHLMAGSFQIKQLILLSPPVYLPDNNNPHRHFPNHYAKAFPCLSNIKSGRYFLFRPTRDKILEPLAGDDIRRNYDHNDLRHYPDANIAAVPDKQDEVVVPFEPLNKHWEPCDPAVWTRHDLWQKVGCV